MTSFYGAWPLCSWGEHGAEHLAIWCPAVAAAWLRIGAAHGPSPVRALSGDWEAAACAARLLHQASFIASSIHNKSSVEWREGADWLVRAVCTPDSVDGEAGDGDSGGLARESDPAYAHVGCSTGRRPTGVAAGSARTGLALADPLACGSGCLTGTGVLLRPPGIPSLRRRGRSTRDGSRSPCAAAGPPPRG